MPDAQTLEPDPLQPLRQRRTLDPQLAAGRVGRDAEHRLQQQKRRRRRPRLRDAGDRVGDDRRTLEAVKAATNGKGVDVILDMVGGDYIEKNLRAAAIWGRIVNIAFQKGMVAGVNFASMLMKRLSLMATTLRARSNEEKGAIRDAVRREVWPLIEAGRIKPVVDRVFPLPEAGAAHARIAKSQHIGKLLLKP